MWTGYASVDDIKLEAGDECLVTDITQELSIGLDDPLLLAESVSLFDHDALRGHFISNNRSPTYDFLADCFKTKTEPDDESSPDDGVGFRGDQSSGSGSETSSLEQAWSVKTALDTPPITPPDSRVSPNANRIRIVSANDVTFLPFSASAGDVHQGAREMGPQTATSKQIRLHPSILVPKDDYTIEDNSTLLLGESILASRPDDYKRSGLSKDELQKQQARRKHERMIRNRESAYLSRKRKKEHVTHLERQVLDLKQDNHSLRLENAELKARLSRYEDLPVKGYWRRIPDVPRKTTALLALAVTVCLNIGSFSGVLLDSGQSGDSELWPAAASGDHHGRTLLWTDSLDDQGLANLTSCPVAINQSESMRLERELRRWIVGGKEVIPTTIPNLKRSLQDASSQSRVKRRPRVRKQRPVLSGVDLIIQSQLLRMEGLYEAIHRRADTFYLVSFSPDHLLLPAISRNQSTRPKISVMVPAYLTNSSNGISEHVEMMQIDCEVTNTQLLSVRGDDIPTHMRHVPKYSNVSVDSTNSHQFRFTKHTDDLLMAPDRTPELNNTLRDEGELPDFLIPTNVSHSDMFSYKNSTGNEINSESQSHSTQQFRLSHLLSAERRGVVSMNSTDDIGSFFRHLARG